MLTARRPSPRATLDLVARAGVTVLAAVPMHWAQIAAALRHSPELADNLAGLRAAVSSGDRLPAGLRAELARHGVTLIDALGASECGDVYLWGDHDDALDRSRPAWTCGSTGAWRAASWSGRPARPPGTGGAPT